MSEPRGGRAALVVLLLACLGVSVAHWLDQRSATARLLEGLDRLNQEQARLERAVQLFRFERGSKGLGVHALIEQLRHWAPLLDVSTTAQRELPGIEAKVRDILSALQDLGADAYGPLLDAFRTAESGKDDELRRWLLEGMLRVDRARSLDLAATCLRGWEFAATPRLRTIAGQMLLDHDKPRAAKLLSEILGYESSKGIDRSRLTPDQQKALAAITPAPQPMRMFFNLVDLFVAAGASDTEERLLVVATRPDQDLITVQTAVKHLGKLRAKNAGRAIRKLFEAPPEMAVNPIFQNHCLDAIAEIEGPSACEYFKDQLRRGPDERVSAKLQDLIKTHCRE